MLHEDLEFRISQYIDGTLDDAQRRALEIETARDPAAAELLAQYRQIDDALKTSLPLPNVDYDALAARISDAIDAQDRPHVLYSFKWVRHAVSVAVAACILLVGGLWLRSSGLFESADSNGVLVRVTGPQSESTFAEPIQVIHIGPSPGIAGGPSPATEALVARPSTLVIASASLAPEDNALPY